MRDGTAFSRVYTTSFSCSGKEVSAIKVAVKYARIWCTIPVSWRSWNIPAHSFVLEADVSILLIPIFFCH